MTRLSSDQAFKLFKKTLVAFVLCVTVFFALDKLTVVQAATPRYVNAASGSDVSNSCVNSGSPCKTITRAINQSFPGDTINVAAGTYSAASNGETLPLSPISVTITGAGLGVTIIDGGGNNRAFDVSVGVIATISALTIRNGNAVTGGGIRNAGNLSLTSVTVSGNTAAQGGGIENDSPGLLTIITSTIGSNTSNLTCGAGIFARSTITVTNSAIINNTATSGDGGGLCVQDGTYAVINSTFSGNTASSKGGGIAVESAAATLTLTNSTIANNSAPSGGGGIFITTGAVQVKNTIIANNLTGGNCSSALASNGHNLDSGTTCGLSGTGDKINTNPKLAPLTLNAPGSTMTHGLLAGSLAVNAGDNSGCPPTDQRGVARPIGGVCDIGSFEGTLPTYYFPIIYR